MPRTIEVSGVRRSVATERELLDFANSIRQAGGAGVLEALLPSRPGAASSCLIANALNFSCQVDISDDPPFADDSDRWAMYLPSNLTEEQIEALRKVKGVQLRCLKEEDYSDYDGLYLTLPKHIGNAAEAFDRGAAFESYVVKP